MSNNLDKKFYPVMVIMCVTESAVKSITSLIADTYGVSTNGEDTPTPCYFFADFRTALGADNHFEGAELGFTDKKSRLPVDNGIKIFKPSEFQQALDCLFAEPDIETLEGIHDWSCHTAKTGDVTVGCKNFSKAEAESVVKLVEEFRKKIKLITPSSTNIDGEPYAFIGKVGKFEIELYQDEDVDDDVKLIDRLMVRFDGEEDISYKELIELDAWRRKHDKTRIKK